MLRVDHVIYCVADLDAAARRFEGDFGLASVPGGRHGGWGTENRIVPLGDQYLEIVAPLDRELASANPFGRWVLAAAEEGERPAGWAVATDDIEAIAARLGLEVAEGSRTRPDGTVISWRLAGIDRMLSEASHPLFLQWGVPPDLHPGRAPAAHGVAARGIAWLGLAGDERALDAWLGGERLPLRVELGEPAVRRVAIEVDGETIVLE